jgi:hypothetical protein
VLLALGIAAPARAVIWISPDEIERLPESGDEWEAIVDLADAAYSGPDANSLAGNDNDADVKNLAKAYVCVKTTNTDYCDAVKSNIAALIDPAPGGHPSLEAARNLLSWVIAADLVLTGTDRDDFAAWLDDVFNANFDGRSLVSTHEDLPNNWGCMAGASRMAADLFDERDSGDFEDAIDVLKGFLGNRAVYAFDIDDFGGPSGSEDHSWECDPNAPVPINPLGCTKIPPGGSTAYNLSGSIPDDQRRGGSYSAPPWSNTGYPYECLQGLTAQAWIASRNGYPDVVTWSDAALSRALIWLYTEEPNGNGNPIVSASPGDDGMIPPIANCLLGTSYAVVGEVHSKNMAGTEWTHRDQDGDRVCDIVDNCPKITNVRVTPFEFQTTTGGQLDDDADGFGNQCDAHYGTTNTVGSSDLSAFKLAFGRKRNSSCCGPPNTSCDPDDPNSPCPDPDCLGSLPCDIYDHDNAGAAAAAISSADFAIFKTLFGTTKKVDSDAVEKCPLCGPPFNDGGPACAGADCP